MRGYTLEPIQTAISCWNNVPNVAKEVLRFLKWTIYTCKKPITFIKIVSIIGNKTYIHAIMNSQECSFRLLTVK